MQSSLRQQTDRYAAFMGIALLVVAGALAAANPSTWVGSLPASLANGEWATLYGRNFDKTLVLTTPARQAFGTLSYVGFREGRPGVLGKKHERRDALISVGCREADLFFPPVRGAVVNLVHVGLQLGRRVRIGAADNPWP